MWVEDAEALIVCAPETFREKHGIDVRTLHEVQEIDVRRRARNRGGEYRPGSGIVRRASHPLLVRSGGQGTGFVAARYRAVVAAIG
jgi:hypothetical protein